jgi:hypothetical protein
MNTKTFKVVKTDAEWREQLTPEQYQITRKHGTERAFSSPNFDSKLKGSAFAAIVRSIVLKPNMNPAQAGQVSLPRSNLMRSMRSRIAPMECCAPK